MATVVELHLSGIPQLCRHYGVTRLDLFGSAATDAFEKPSTGATSTS